MTPETAPPLPIVGPGQRLLLARLVACAPVVFVVALSCFPQPIWLQLRPALRCLSVLLLALVWLAAHPAPLVDRHDAPVLWFAAALLPSLVWAERPAIAWSGTGVGWIGYRELILMGLAWYLITRHTMNGARLRRLSRWLLVVVALVAAFGYLEIITRQNILYAQWFKHPYYATFIRQPRMMSTQEQPVVLGTLLVMTLPFAVHYAATARRRIWRLLASVAAVALAGALVLTFSRGSLIALAVSVAAYAVVIGKRRWLLPLAGLILAIILVCSVWVTAGSHRYSVKGLALVPQQLRWSNAALVFRQVREHPLTGIGLNHYRYLYDRYRPGNAVRNASKIPDNMHLNLLAEAGLVGTLGFWWLVWCTARRWVDRINAARARAARSLIAAVGAGWLGLLANMLTYDALFWMLPLGFFWIWLGILWAGERPPGQSAGGGAVQPVPRRAWRAASTALPPITAIEWLGVGCLLAVLTWWLNVRSLQSFLFNSDFGNLFHALRLNPWHTVEALSLLNGGFRPVGLCIYHMLHRLCGLEASWYHALLLCLHVLACAQAYWVTLRLTRSRFVALAACLGLVYQFAYRDIFWHFGKVFEVLAALWYWQALAWYLEARHAGGGWRWLASLGAFVLALGSKEMAVTLPVMLTLYELLWDTSWRSRDRRRAWCHLVVRWQCAHYVVAALFFVQHFLLKDATPGMRGYAFLFTPSTWLEGMAYYLREWGCSLWPSSWLFVLGGLAFACAWWLQDRVLIFGWCYVVIAFLPVIFLAHHRYPWYWYMPQFGAALFAAQALQRLRGWLTCLHAPSLRATGLRWLVTLALVMTPLWTALGASATRRASAEQWYCALSHEYRGFMRQLQAIHPTVPRHSVLAFTQPPSFLDAEYLTYFLRLIYHDDTVQAVLDPPPAVLDRLARNQPVFLFSYAEGRVQTLPAPVPPGSGAAAADDHL